MYNAIIVLITVLPKTTLLSAILIAELLDIHYPAKSQIPRNYLHNDSDQFNVSALFPGEFKSNYHSNFTFTII